MELHDAIMNRRSHRSYKPEMPPREALERVVQAALWAPSAGGPLGAVRYERPGLGDHGIGR